MAMPINAATAAYGRASQLISDAARSTSAPTSTGVGAGGDFGAILAETVQGVVDSGKIADSKAMDLVNGKGDVIDVVTAISQTELAMETMVTVRDRVISAYEEIMRMPI